MNREDVVDPVTLDPPVIFFVASNVRFPVLKIGLKFLEVEIRSKSLPSSVPATRAKLLGGWSPPFTAYRALANKEALP